MLAACPDCKAYYLVTGVDTCPCGEDLLVLDDSREDGLAELGFRAAVCQQVGPGEHEKLFSLLEGLTLSGAKFLQGADDGRPSVQYLELDSGSRIWLTAGQGVAAVHALTLYAEVRP